MIPAELLNVKPMTGKERLGSARDSDYLGAEDLDENSEPILTIQHIYNAVVTLQRGKERKDVITFVEESVPGIRVVRPLIVNATNRKTLRKIYKAVTAENLEGKRIQLYLEHNVRDPSTGDKVDGIRIRPKIPSGNVAPTPKCEVCGNPIKAFGQYTAEQVAQLGMEKYGKRVCIECGGKLKVAQAESEEAQNVTE